MKNVMKKIGWTVVSMLPVLLFFVIQLGCAFVAMIGIVIKLTAEGPDIALDAGTLTEALMERYLDNVIPVLIASQLLAVLVFGLWYFFVYGKKKRPEGTEKPKAYRVLLILLLGLMVQFAISGVLSLIDCFAPSALEEYNELMEMAGIGELTPLVLLSTTILAPISEELACRGLVFKLAGKISPRFWVANIVQALAFGILHANLVQGAYAFVLGVILGLLYGKFRNIWLCMLLHAAMNLSSIFVGPFYSLFPEEAALPVYIVTMAAATAASVFCIRGILGGRSASAQETARE